LKVRRTASNEIEAGFNESVKYVASLDRENCRAQQIIAALRNPSAESAARRA
jgi:hypothetical protein